ncbi:hypothetical protein FKW77_003035 [Venturia effusa]|uniref:FAD-binding PCMH-type domain-containing protein n=1 Tax=Venturia effusa TaxID=50376 RepID=A0A517LGT0_9PEZI|nr:hypothetical protein FKW77_003035 [Venturia effusa]
MGQGQSSAGGLQDCLTSAVGSGNLAVPSKPFYQQTDVKPYNLDIHVHPVAVTYPQTNEDVAAIVRCAKEHEAKVQPRSGGHSYGNFATGNGNDNMIVVDLKHFKQFSMDDNTWIATLGSGHLLGDVTKKLLANGGRAMAHGTCPQVGIGGHATIGGLGPMSRMWGSSLDHVQEITVVLANSSIITASPTQNKDVFWAMKGAGASFGIITEFKVITHPAPGEAVKYSFGFSGGSHRDQAKRFKKWQSMIADPGLSRKLASQVVLSEIGMIISGTFFGTQAEYNQLNLTSVFPEMSSHKIIVFNDWAGLVGHWAEDVGLQLGGGISSPFYSKSLAFTPNDLIPAEGIDRFFEYLDEVDKGTLIWFGIFDLEGGATNDIPADATAYGHRDALFYFQSYGVNLGLKVKDETRDFINGMNSVLEGSLSNHKLGAYAGYVDPALSLEAAQVGYWGDNLPRLRQIKRAVDPDDVFHNLQSVRPAAS